MTIRFTNTRRDLLMARLMLTFTNKALAGFYILLGVLIIYGDLSGKEFAAESTGMKVLVVSVHLALFYALIFILMTGFTLVQLFSQSQKGVIGEHSLRITDEGLEEKTDYNVSLNRWAAFSRCKRVGGYWFIYVTDNLVHVVPAKRPLLEGNIESFVAEIKRITAKAP